MNNQKSETISGPEKITVHEHRAPTDESIRILNEFEEKARENIIHKAWVSENNIKAFVMVYFEDQACDEYVYQIKFNLNGKDYYIKDRISRREWMAEYHDPLKKSFGVQRIANALFQYLSKIIAWELLKGYQKDTGSNIVDTIRRP